MSVNRPTLKYVTAAVRAASVNPLDAQLIFTHIPKAAGTTLDHIISSVARAQANSYRRAVGTYLGQWLGNDKPEALESFQKYIAASDPVANVRYLTGHIPYGVHKQMSGVCHYVTILRDPIARCLSHFRLGVQHGAWDAATPIGSLFESGRLVANSQTRQLAGLVTIDQPCGEAELAIAMDNLAERYALAATTKRFNDVLMALIALFGWPDIVYADFQVTDSHTHAPLSKGALQEIRDRNRLDAELYAAVCRRESVWHREFSAVLSEGSRDPTPRQDAVLVVRPYGQVRFIEQSLFRELEQDWINAGQPVTYF